MILYRIRDWAKHFENSRTEIIQHLNWVPLPNRLDGAGFTELADHPDGAAHYGVWVSLVLIASRCHAVAIDGNGVSEVPFRDGSLLKSSGKPHDAKSLSRITGFSEKITSAAIERLIVIRWLETTSIPMAIDGNDIATLDGNQLPLSRTLQNSTELKKDSHIAAERIYQLYPRKVGHGKAIEAIRKALGISSEEILAEAVREFAKSPAGMAGQFCPHPATWFNHRRWEDDRAEWTRRDVSAPAKPSIDYNAEMRRRLGVADAND